MSKSTISYKNPIYNISDAASAEELYKTCHALGSKERIAILNLIQTRPMTIKELSQILNLPVSSITLHTNILNGCRLYDDGIDIHTPFGWITKSCSLGCILPPQSLLLRCPTTIISSSFFIYQ